LSVLILSLTKIDIPRPNFVILNMGPDTEPIKKMNDLQGARSFENNLWQVDASHPSHVAENVAFESKVSGKQSIESLKKLKHLVKEIPSILGEATL
jgi:hypothetical protein